MNTPSGYRGNAVLVKLSKKLCASLTEIANAQERSRSEVIREACRIYISLTANPQQMHLLLLQAAQPNDGKDIGSTIS